MAKKRKSLEELLAEYQAEREREEEEKELRKEMAKRKMLKDLQRRTKKEEERERREREKEAERQRKQKEIGLLRRASVVRGVETKMDVNTRRARYYLNQLRQRYRGIDEEVSNILMSMEYIPGQQEMSDSGRMIYVSKGKKSLRIRKGYRTESLYHLVNRYPQAGLKIIRQELARIKKKGYRTKDSMVDRVLQVYQGRSDISDVALAYDDKDIEKLRRDRKVVRYFKELVRKRPGAALSVLKAAYMKDKKKGLYPVLKSALLKMSIKDVLKEPYKRRTAKALAHYEKMRAAKKAKRMAKRMAKKKAVKTVRKKKKKVRKNEK